MHLSIATALLALSLTLTPFVVAYPMPSGQLQIRAPEPAARYTDGVHSLSRRVDETGPEDKAARERELATLRQKKWRQDPKNREKEKERRKANDDAYRNAHREEYAAYQKKYYDQHKDARKLYKQQWYAQKKESRLRDGQNLGSHQREPNASAGEPTVQVPQTTRQYNAGGNYNAGSSGQANTPMRQLVASGSRHPAAPAQAIPPPHQAAANMAPHPQSGMSGGYPMQPNYGSPYGGGMMAVQPYTQAPYGTQQGGGVQAGMPHPYGVGPPMPPAMHGTKIPVSSYSSLEDWAGKKKKAGS